MRTGVFYRSEALTQLSNADWATLSTMNIRLVVDLRTPSEIAGPVTSMAPNAGQDRLPAGASPLNGNVYGTYYPPSSPTLNSSADSVAYFRSLYRGFVADQADRSGLHDALIALANAPGAALFHCSGGKDRAGWTAVLLQTIAGVPRASSDGESAAGGRTRVRRHGTGSMTLRDRIGFLYGPVTPGRLMVP